NLELSSKYTVSDSLDRLLVCPIRTICFISTTVDGTLPSNAERSSMATPSIPDDSAIKLFPPILYSIEVWLPSQPVSPSEMIVPPSSSKLMVPLQPVPPPDDTSKLSATGVRFAGKAVKPELSQFSRLFNAARNV